MKNKKAFTLIELVSVLVILAILALIVTPLVLNIIRKAKTAADRRSVDAYGKAVELAIASHTMDTGQIPTNLDSLEVEYNGKEVVCTVKQLKENGGLYMSQCTVNGKDVKDSNTDDGWYHYGTRDLTNEEYIDMYGDALKEASLAYYEEHNEIVSDYTTLDIDYKGKEVSCNTIINYDGTVYMENCTVAGKQVDNYTYGEVISYNIGDEVTYNNVDYYVIRNSDYADSKITLLKAEPLTTEEVDTYGVGHINRNTIVSQGIVHDHNGYGAIAYYSSSTCKSEKKNSSEERTETGCTTSYEQSEIKFVVDAWAQAKTNSNDLVADSTGYSVRLLSFEDLTTNLGYENRIDTVSPSSNGTTPSFVYNSNYMYWTMSPYGDSTTRVFYVSTSGMLAYTSVYNNGGYSSFYGYSYFDIVVRPVITIKKSALK